MFHWYSCGVPAVKAANVTAAAASLFDSDTHTTTHTPEHTHTHTVLQRRLAVETAQVLLPQEVSEDVPEGLSSHLRALLHTNLPLGLTGSRLADLRPLSTGVGVATACECPRQTLLS